MQRENANIKRCDDNLSRVPGNGCLQETSPFCRFQQIGVGDCTQWRLSGTLTTWRSKWFI